MESSGYAEPKVGVSGYATPFLTPVRHGVADVETHTLIIPFPKEDFVTKLR